jgi:hypothetical protein
MANTAMEQVRKGMRASLPIRQRRGLMHDRFILLKREHELTAQERFLLDNWRSLHPALGEAYRLKEEFFAVYDAPSKIEAARRYQEWETSIPQCQRAAFAPIVTAWGNWHDDILAYFDHPITNAYTESLNNLIRVMNRIGRGYSFEALRAKILFTEGPQKRKATRPKFERVNRREPFVTMRAMSALSYDVPIWDDEESERSLGVDIEKLTNLIETGPFLQIDR